MFLYLSVSAATLDINILYEASSMKVKETACGFQPDLKTGYYENEDGCFEASYTLDVPMYGFTFEPKTKDVPADTKCAYYITFFDSAIPKDNMVKTEIAKNGKVIGRADNFMHDRTFQGVLMLGEGENIRLSSAKEPSYMYIYIAALIVIAAGLFFIWKKR